MTVVPVQIKNRAYAYGAQDIVNSWRRNKKYAVLYNNKWIHFGDNRYQDFTTHRDHSRRKNYRSRSSQIRNRSGALTYRNKNYANFWAYHVLW